MGRAEISDLLLQLGGSQNSEFASPRVSLPMYLWLQISWYYLSPVRVLNFTLHMGMSIFPPKSPEPETI